MHRAPPRTGASLKIGILGGTFDPPHHAHLALARAAMEQLELDEVLWIPAARNPLKRARSEAPKHRMEMVRLALESEKDMAMSDIEVGRGGPSYTTDTLSELVHVKPGEYWVIVGADALRTFQEWKAPEKILKVARLAVAIRPPYKKDEILSKVPPEFAGHIDWIQMPESEISATDIRLRSEEKRPFAHLVPSKVYDYIKKHKLYGL